MAFFWPLWVHEYLTECACTECISDRNILYNKCPKLINFEPFTRAPQNLS